MASERWAGFTDEDIKRIKTSPSTPSNKSQDLKEKDVVAATEDSGKLKEPAQGFRQQTIDSDASEDETSDSDPEVKRKPQRSKKSMKTKETSSTNHLKEINCKNMTWERNGNEMSDDSCISSDASKKENEEKNFDSSMQELELFEIRQKRIEAENARRRALINKAVMDKHMQTHAEVVKLRKITQELNHLDSILSADVSILRDYIEKASQEFSDAEKKYLKAEKEFIDAKLELYEKMQRKKQLTEHLCAIIEQNENRKANKLVELMKQLEMEAIIEEYDINSSQPILSKFCMMNDETYHCCSTLKPPSPNPSSISTEKTQARTQISPCCHQEQNINVPVEPDKE